MPSKKTFKIASWNVNSIRVRETHIIDWLSTHKPDVLALQETKCQDENFPTDVFESLGYHVLFSGQKTFNGVAIISRTQGEAPLTDIPGLDDPQRRILVATFGDIRVVDLYVPNGSEVDSEKHTYKHHWLQQVTQFIKKELQTYPKLIVLGDFNIAPEPIDVYDPDKWKDSVLFSEKDRKALQTLLDVGLADSFRLLSNESEKYSWWDYRTFAFRGNRGLRIDHILVSEALKSQCETVGIDTEPRALEKPSDHAPVWLDLEL